MSLVIMNSVVPVYHDLDQQSRLRATCVDASAAADKSDVFDVLDYIAFALPPTGCGRTRSGETRQLAKKFVDFEKRHPHWLNQSRLRHDNQVIEADDGDHLADHAPRFSFTESIGVGSYRDIPYFSIRLSNRTASG
jgi:hypothetical protein